MWRSALARRALRTCSVAVVVTLASLSPAAAPRLAEADADWLEQPLVGWNQAGADVPAPPENIWANPRCTGTARWPESPPDQAVVDARWDLVGPYRGGWGLTVVTGTTGYDGMCRPMGFQSFVFQDGAFVGTISPEAMVARDSGSGTVTGVRQDGITARFLRYAPEDARCCPSLGAVVIDYRVMQTDDGPVLMPSHVYREPDPAPRPA